MIWARPLPVPATAFILALCIGFSLHPLCQPPARSGRGDSRGGVPEWETSPLFEKDAFTFVRIQYSSGRSRGWGGAWRVDYPAADLNFSWRLQQLTSITSNPNGHILRLTDPDLHHYPFIFIIDPRNLVFSEEEAQALRAYLLNGGFLMVDDFWGEQMRTHFENELRKVFPDKGTVSLPIEHPIFNIVYPLDFKPQVPSEDSAHRSRESGSTWEDEISWETPKPADYRAILDDKQRVMVLLCHNTDLSDGWEEEGVSEWFFKNFSEKLSYPLGINILVYTMTH